MRRYLFLFILSILLIDTYTFAQEENLVDSVALQQRIDSEIDAFMKWKDSMARAKGLSPQDKKADERYPLPGLPTREDLEESERKLSQFKKIIVSLFVLVMLVGVFLSKPWKKKGK